MTDQSQLTDIQEVESLNRVLTRLALTDEKDLEKVLTKLLPIVIDQLKSKHDRTRKKVLEMLLHVNKRVRDHREIGLPLEALLSLFQKPDAPPLVRNFALVYVEMAMERSSALQQIAVLPKLLQGIGARPQLHRDLLLRLAFTALESMSVTGSAWKLGTEAEFAAKYPSLAEQSDRAAFLEFGLKFLLYQPADKKAAQEKAATEAGRAVAIAQQLGLPDQVAEGSGTPPPVLPPPGMAWQDVPRIEGKKMLSRESLTLQRLGFLNFTSAAGIAPEEVVRHYLVAACDSADAAGRVGRRGDELLRKRCAVDSPKPVVDLEDGASVDMLFALFLGVTDSGSTGRMHQDAVISPAAPPLRVRLMGLFNKSLSAANRFPATLQVIMACVYGADTTMRLKQLGMEFAVWVFKHASEVQLEPMAPAILAGLLRLLDEEIPPDNAGRALRSFTYQAIGQLAGRSPQLVRSRVDIAVRCFDALSTEPSGVRAAVQEAVSTLAIAYEGCSGESAAAIEALLLSNISSEHQAARFCSVRWASQLFPFSHVPARYICLIGAGDEKLDVREAALSGLRPVKSARPGKGAPAVIETVVWPSSSAIIACVQARHSRLLGIADMGQLLPLQPKTFAALVSMLRTCRQQERAAIIGSHPVDAETLPDAESFPLDYTGLLEHALVRDASSELQLSALEALLEVAGTDPAVFAEQYSHRMSWLRGFLNHHDAAARDAAAKLVGLTSGGLPAATVAALLLELIAAFPGQTRTQKGIAPVRFEEQDGSIAAAGYTLARCLSGTLEIEHEQLSSAARSLAALLRLTEPTLISTAAAALGHAGLRGVLPLPLGEAAPAPVKAEILKTEGSTSVSTSTAAGNKTDSTVPAKVSEDPLPTTRRAVMDDLSKLFTHKDNKVVLKAAVAVGHLCYGNPEAETLDAALECLFGLSMNKAEEVQFAAGEALCYIFGGAPVTADTMLYSNYSGLATWLTAISKDEDAKDVAPASDAAPTIFSSAQSSAQDRILNKILDELIFNSRPEVRCAGCVWLLSLVSYTGRHPKLLPLLPDIQDAFSHLLGDTNELTQEMASRGMSIVYSIGDDAAQKQLLDGLMGVLQGGPRKRRAVKLTGETQVFEEGQIGQAPGGGSIGTYKELCALATDLGQPELVYRFMDLANHAASLNSTRGAAFGFASIAKLAGEQLQPYVDKMVPKLYRYQYDPNGRVRDAMAHIWAALVPEPKVALDAHFGDISDELLKEVGGRMWRSREAACLALADLIQGRRWPEVASRFEQFWSMTLRALDDIKESVRAAATTLVRTLRSLTLRIADPQLSPPAHATAAITVALPLLLEKGLGSAVGEVAALAVDTLSKLVNAAGAAQVRPLLPDVVPPLLESLSTLEDSRLNYIEQHAERLGMDMGRLDAARDSAARSSPVGDTLDLCARYTDAATLEALVPRLVPLVKRGVGLNTRVGTARFISSLAMRLGSDLKPSAAALIKALVGAARVEKSSAVRRAYASSAAMVARNAPDARVGKLVAEAVEMYTEPGDRESRQLGGLILRELARNAADVFGKHASQAMPIAFIAKSDEETDVAALWAEVWEDSGSSAPAALRLYMADIIPLLLLGLQSQQWGRKKASALAVSGLAENGVETLAPHALKLADGLLNEMPGRLWDGKEAVLAALAALAKGCPKSLGSDGGGRIVAALLEATGRKKSEFRQAALKALETAVLAFPDDYSNIVGPPLIAALKQHGDAADSIVKSAAVPLEEAAKGEESEKLLPLLEVVSCLAAVWQRTTAESATECGDAISKSFAISLNPGYAWHVRLAGLTAAKHFIEHMGRLNAAGSQKLSEVVGEIPIAWPSSQLSSPQLTWVAAFLPGLMAGTREAKVSQVRTAALEALGDVLQASSGGRTLTPREMEEISTNLREMIAYEKSTVVKAHILKVQDLLVAVAVPMDI